MWVASAGDGGECSLELRTTVTETADAVFITLEQRGTSGDACGNAAQIELAEPVGDRDVVDQAAGRRWGRGIDPGQAQEVDQGRPGRRPTAQTW